MIHTEIKLRMPLHWPAFYAIIADCGVTKPRFGIFKAAPEPTLMLVGERYHQSEQEAFDELAELAAMYQI